MAGVQSPAVRLVVEREKEIKAFSSTTHYGAELTFENVTNITDGWKASLLLKPCMEEGQEYLQDKSLTEKAAELRLHKLYRQAHKNLPKDLRLTTGEQILTEITTSLGCIAAANFAGKTEQAGRLRAASQLTRMRERLEVIGAFLSLAWEEKAISHHQLADLSSRLDELGKKTTRWGQWFERGTNLQQ